MTFVDQIKKIGRILGVQVAGSNVADCLNSLEVSVTNKATAEGRKLDMRAINKPEPQPVVEEPVKKVETVAEPEKADVVASAPTQRRPKRSRAEKTEE